MAKKKESKNPEDYQGLEKVLLIGFSNPFNSRGIPARYLSLLIPLMNQEKTTKIEMLQSARLSTHKSSSGSIGTYSTTFAKLTRAGILKTGVRGKGTSEGNKNYWHRGENFHAYLGYVMLQLMAQPSLNNKFVSMIVDYGSNSLNFILKED